MFYQNLSVTASIRVAVNNFQNSKKDVLPISITKDNKRCLDFDMDKVVFKQIPKSPSSRKEQVKQYNESAYEMV